MVITGVSSSNKFDYVDKEERIFACVVEPSIVCYSSVITSFYYVYKCFLSFLKLVSLPTTLFLSTVNWSFLTAINNVQHIWCLSALVIHHIVSVLYICLSSKHLWKRVLLLMGWKERGLDGMTFSIIWRIVQFALPPWNCIGLICLSMSKTRKLAKTR